MGKIVKGIVIPDEAYLDYGRGAGPQRVNNNQSVQVDIDDPAACVVNGMRMFDVFNAELNQNAEQTSSQQITKSLDGLSVTIIFDTTQFLPGDAVLTLFDKEEVKLVAEPTVQMVAAP